MADGLSPVRAAALADQPDLLTSMSTSRKTLSSGTRRVVALGSRLRGNDGKRFYLNGNRSSSPAVPCRHARVRQTHEENRGSQPLRNPLPTLARSNPCN